MDISFISSAVPSGSGAFQMPTRPSSALSASSASTLRGGKGQSQKRFSNFFSFYAPGDDSPHGGILLLLCPYVRTYVCMSEFG